MNTFVQIGAGLGIVGWAIATILLGFVAWDGHTHDPTGIQTGSTICLEFGTLHYPDPLGADAHIPAAFCGEVVEKEKVPALGENTHLAQ